MFNNAHHIDLRNGNFSNVGGNSYTNYAYYGSPGGWTPPTEAPNGVPSSPPRIDPRQRSDVRIPAESTSTPIVQESEEPGLYLLSLDGGGIRGLSELVILDEIMKRIGHDEDLTDVPPPCNYFDLIGGTSTGGLVALMLGRLRMSTGQAIHHYSNLAGRVFSEKKWAHQDGLFKASRFEEAVKEMVQSALTTVNPSEPMLDPRPREKVCKTFVCAVPALHVTGAGGPRLFRTYSARENDDYNCAIWEAARATSAAPTFFKRIQIGFPNAREEFIDAGVGCNNPVKQVHEEAEALWPSQSVACMVSIGTGRLGTVALQSPGALQRLLPTNLIPVLRGIATDCERVAEDYRKDRRKDRRIGPSQYFRFNVEHGMQGISLDEWQRLGEVRQHTKQYLQMSAVSEDVDRVVEILRKRTRRS